MNAVMFGNASTWSKYKENCAKEKKKKNYVLKQQF